MHGPSSTGLVNNVGRVQAMLARTGQRLATGRRINHGRDDPAGLVASLNLEARLAALEAESRALARNDAVVRTADAALAEVGDLLNRKDALDVAAANTGAMSDAEREAIAIEQESLERAAARAVRSASFAGEPLFSGGLTIPAAGGEPLELDVNEAQLTAEGVAMSRGRIGSFQRHAIDARRASVSSAIENLSGANSLIRDTDYAHEGALYTRLRTLSDSGAAVLALANQRRAGVLAVLGGAGPTG